MPSADWPKIGIFCSSAVDDDLAFALRSIQLNTDYPDFCFLVGADARPDGSDPVPILETYKAAYPWFDFVHFRDRTGERSGLKSANDMLESLFQRLVERGCTRFFQINDDVSVTRYWLHYAEDAIQRVQGEGVVIPHDGIVSVDSSAGFCGFYFFSLAYVRRFHPHGTAFRTTPLQCYWIDTEFCVRAARHGRLLREPRCCVLHLHHTRLPKPLMGSKPRRGTQSSSERDGLLFIQQMKREGIDPWRYIPNLAAVTPPAILEQMRTLRGLED